ncbi:CRISPR-associated protein Cas6 [Paenibacillus sp. SYP-B3998]|uniref:CRISPR-associated protein Cas6 n=1 Tax=Paenibacillus sp. SYP-B3998 TaxID=2678564 RepID=A0A6G4A059_9BACL|nr:CRISPR-associated protein Cas6 [Paenibacillus sp. SYP-B3998]NEW07866.1 CRISPR-associated protein Cas6 [Paenibacillus sp. SYP-B3998]
MVDELKLTILLKQSTHHLAIQEHIGNWLHRAQLSDEEFKASHYERAFKHIVFSSLIPIEKDGIYQQGRAYVLTIRSPLRDTLQRLKLCMQQCREDEHFQLVTSEIQRPKRMTHITEMLAITPVIVTVNRKPWLHENSVEQLLQQLHNNAVKKLLSLEPETQVEEGNHFIQGIRVENKKPIGLHYKGRKLLGNKLKLFINDDPQSQRLAQTVFASGLGEKGSSIGAGFCLAKYLV